MLCVGHDAVVGTAGPGAAGAGAVLAKPLRGGPAVEFHEVAFRSAAVQPGVTEVVPEPMGVHGYAALAAAAALRVSGLEMHDVATRIFAPRGLEDAGPTT